MFRFALALAALSLTATTAFAELPKQTVARKASASSPMKVVVIGDSLANGLYTGLRQLNVRNKHIKTTKRSRPNTGLTRSDRYNWNRGAAQIAKSGKYDAAVVLIGLNDIQTIREGGKSYHYNTKGWISRYRSRVNRMARDLKNSGMAVYWVSIPIVRSPKMQRRYSHLNRFYREAAKKYGLRYVDTWKAMADSKGRYTPSHKFSNGKRRIIRARDGIHFTTSGYVVFAKVVNRVLLANARLRRQAKLAD